MAGTDVTYNGVTLLNVLTRNWDMQAIYDEDDSLSYFKLNMQFETIFLPSTGVEHMGVTGGATAPAAWNINKKKLLTPRKNLTITMGGVLVLDVLPFTKNTKGYVSGANETDVKNGPRPISLDFDQVMGSTSIRATYTIEVCLSPCEDKIPPVLASRWTVSEVMDEDFFITRTFSGFVKKQSSGHSSASYRWWMYPPLEPGFKRTNVTFDEHADHLGIDWQVTDRQVHTSPPWPCTKLEGSQTETTGNGIVWHSEVRVRATGSPEASKRDMFAQCGRIIEMRIGYGWEDALGKGNKFLMKGCTMVDFFGAKNQVEMVMRIEHNWAANEDEDKFKTFLTNLRGRIADPAYYDLATKAPGTPVAEPAPYDKLKSRLPWVWGYTPHGDKRTADLSARWEHYLTNLCSAQDRPSKVGAGDPKTTGTKTSTVKDSPTTADVDKPISTDDTGMFDRKEQQELYTLARVEDEYAYDPRVAVLPVLTQDNTGGYAGASGLSSYVVNIGKPTIYRILTVEYERLGSWPAIPELKPTYKDPLSNQRFQLVKHRVVAKPPNPGQDGKQVVYAVWAQYVYVCKSDLKKKTLADWDWSLISLPMTTLTHHIEHKKLWRDVNGGKLDSGQGSETSQSNGGT